MPSTRSWLAGVSATKGVSRRSIRRRTAPAGTRRRPPAPACARFSDAARASAPIAQQALRARRPRWPGRCARRRRRRPRRPARRRRGRGRARRRSAGRQRRAELARIAGHRERQAHAASACGRSSCTTRRLQHVGGMGAKARPLGVRNARLRAAPPPPACRSHRADGARRGADVPGWARREPSRSGCDGGSGITGSSVSASGCRQCGRPAQYNARPVCGRRRCAPLLRQSVRCTRC